MARTLPANITDNYLNTGKQPRVFVNIPDANMFLGTKAATIGTDTFENQLKSSGSITWEIDKYGGMGKVSGVTIRNLDLGQDIDFATNLDIDDKLTVSTPGAGRIQKSSSVYQTAREATAGDDISYANITVGRRSVGEPALYYTYRGFIQFDIPSGLTSCEEAELILAGSNDSAASDFEIYVIEANWSAYGSPLMYDDFAGWQSGLTAYTDTVLNKTYRTEEFSASSIANAIRFNTDGRAAVVSNAGSTLKLMILSKNDYAGSAAPVYDEYIKYVAQSVVLRLKYNTYNLDNKEATVYIAYEPVPSALTSMLKEWTGVIDSYEINDRSLSLTLRQNNFKKDIVIPKNKITDDNWANSPDSNMGKPYPIVYGDFENTLLHKTGVANFSGYGPIGTLINIAYPDCFKIPIVENLNESIKLIFSELRIKSGSFPIFTFDSNSNSYVMLLSKGGVVVWDAAGESRRTITPYTDTTRFPDALGAYEHGFQALSAVMPYKHAATGVGATDIANTYDTDTDTYGTLADYTGTFKYYFKSPAKASKASLIGFVVYAEFTGGADPTLLHFMINRNKKTAYDDADDWTQLQNLTPWTKDDQYQYGFFLVDANNERLYTPLDEYELYLFREDSTGDVNIYDVWAFATYPIDEVKELYTYGQGHYDSDGTITTLNALYENPAHIIESIARDEMSLDSDTLNETSFDTAATTLTAWKMALQILDRKEAMEIIDKLSRQSKSRMYWDNEDKLSVHIFDADEDYPNASDSDAGYIPGDLDIFDEDAVATNEVFTNHPIAPNSIRIYPVPIDEVYNDFTLEYKVNYATGDTEEVLYMTHGDGVAGSVETNMTEAYLENSQTLTALKTLCADSYNNIITTNTFVFKATAIRDEATANKLLQYLIERTTKRRWMVDLTTWQNALGVELGDYINVRNNRLDDLFTTAEMNRKKWEVIRRIDNLDNHQISLTAIEV